MTIQLYVKASKAGRELFFRKKTNFTGLDSRWHLDEEKMKSVFVRDEGVVRHRKGVLHRCMGVRRLGAWGFPGRVFRARL